MLTGIHFEKFTAFENIKVDFSPGINIIIGENGTGCFLTQTYQTCHVGPLAYASGSGFGG